MATLARAEELLEQLRGASIEAGQRDLKEVQEFAAEQGAGEALAHWDVSFWSERLKEAKYALEEEQLRPYFALPNVLEVGADGLQCVWGRCGCGGAARGQAARLKAPWAAWLLASACLVYRLWTNPTPCTGPSLKCPHPPLPAPQGLFALAKRLFDVDIEPADGQVPVWHPDVRFFSVKKGGQPKAYFYLDPYSRPAEKRGGAW
jgi:Zn-dependent oligopeptidase